MFLSRSMEPEASSTFRQQAAERGIEVRTTTRDQLTTQTESSHHQGVALSLASMPYSTLDELFERARQRHESPLIVVLDSVTDPHNLVAVIRSAEAVGFHGVIIPERRAAGLTGVGVKSSAGAAGLMPVVRVKNLSRTMDELKKRNVWLYGAESADNANCFTTDFSGAAAIVVGSEGSGLRRIIREKCDFLVSIPIYGKVESLNVSVAAALLMYEVRRSRS